jgi:hypothetical protein
MLFLPITTDQEIPMLIDTAPLIDDLRNAAIVSGHDVQISEVMVDDDCSRILIENPGCDRPLYTIDIISENEFILIQPISFELCGAMVDGTWDDVMEYFNFDLF